MPSSPAVGIPAMPEKEFSKSFSNGDQIPVSTQIKKSSRQLALLEFRCKVEDAILSNPIIPNSDQEDLRDVSLWGVPLLPSKCDERTDTILHKFLKAKDYKVSQAFKMLQNTLQWRIEAELKGILEEDFGLGYENVGFINGVDKFGHPLCYRVYGELTGKDYENWEILRRWNIQFMEKCIQELDFKPGGMDCIVQIIDLKNAPESLIKDIRLAGKKSVLAFQENYPGLVFKSIIINSPLWVSAFPTMHLRYITQKKNKHIFVRPSRVTKTLVKYISPEAIPIQYGGLNREKDNEFSSHDSVLTQKLRGGSIEQIKIYIGKGEVSVIWHITVGEFEVEYKAEFIPEDDCSYRILIQKEKKMEESVRNSFYISEPGKLVFTIENLTFKKKFIYFRSKIKPFLPIYPISRYSKSRYNIT